MSNFLVKGLFFSLICTLFTQSNAQSLEIQSDYTIRFDSDVPSGVFNDLEGSIAFDETDFSSAQFNLKIAIDSIDVGGKLYNKHATGPKWLDSEQFPFLTFDSESVVKTDTGYSANGELTLHGITKTIDIPFSYKEQRFKGTFDVNRTDYEIGKPGGKVAEVLTITFDIPVK